jgi:hypothetical protein
MGQPDEALTRRFTPGSVARGIYVVYHSERPIEAVVAELRARDSSPAPGAWKPAREDALEAFDAASRTDRFRIAELYVGIHPFVARGSLKLAGRRVAYTVISPSPDATLTRLLPGTMIIVFNVPF